MGNHGTNESRENINIEYLNVYQKLICMDFDEELAMRAAQTYPTDIQSAALFVLKNQSYQTYTTPNGTINTGIINNNNIDEDKDDGKDDEKMMQEGWVLNKNKLFDGVYHQDLNNTTTGRQRKYAMTCHDSSQIAAKLANACNVNDNVNDLCNVNFCPVLLRYGQRSNVNGNGTNNKMICVQIDGTKKSTEIDWSIFLDFLFKKTTEEETDECNGNVNECAAIKRLITALLYYNLLTKRDNTSGNGNECGLSIFSDFLAEMYVNYLNDNVHLSTIHDKDLDLVYEILCSHPQFIECNVDSCLASDRHCNISDAKNGCINQTQKQISNVSSFHQQIFDTLHFYLFHLFELGLRQTTRQVQVEGEKEKEEEETKQDDNWQCFDRNLKKQRFCIESKRKKFARFSTRFEPQTNKFNIDMVINNNTTREGRFNLDTLYQHISDIKQDNDICIDHHINNFQHYICEQEFDSDAIMQDLNEQSELSNILSLQSMTSCPALSDSIDEYIQQYMLQDKVFFSTGFSFFYWAHFGDDKRQEIRVQNEQNRNEYGGYSPFELFIKQAKYCSLKQEMLSNYEANKIDIEKYNGVITKTNEYIETRMVKQMKYEDDELGWDDIQYFEISEGASITKLHLHSLSFYTDFSELSTAFSATFRRIKVSETLESVKERNRNYWWLSKLLMEAVNCFGSNNWEQNNNNERIVGPFYCGMNMVMEVPSFMIRLCGPTSTTTQIGIAANFAAGDGIILELNNITSLAVRLGRLFSVAWLSRFKGEAECLFIGGQWPIEIISIRITATFYNYADFFHCLSKYDAAIKGDEGETTQGFSKQDANIIELLFQKDKTLPKYIIDTWQIFSSHKTTLIINLLYVIGYYPSDLRDLIVESTDKNGGVFDEDEISYVDITDHRNLLNAKVLMAFPHLTHIEIYCTSPSGAMSYQFGLCVLLDMLSSLPKEKKIKCSLYGVWKKDCGSGINNKRSWLYYVYSLISESLSIKYKTIKTSIKESKDYVGYRRDLLIFEK